MKEVRHPLFASLGDGYPYALEERFERILIKIEQLWDTPEIDDYFSDLIIDKRGGRQGFPREVLNDILHLRQFRESQTIGEAERAEYAKYLLRQRGYELTTPDFFSALEAGDQELIDLYTRAKFNIHILDEWGATPMLAALKRGHTVTAGILLNAGSDVNARDRLGLTPILVACGKPSHGFRSITERLIARGADINGRDPMGNTPLILAISGGMFDIAEVLVERGAEVAPLNRKGQSALSLMHRPGIAPDHPLIGLLLKKLDSSKAARGEG